MSSFSTQNKAVSVVIESGEELYLLVRSSDSSFDLYRRKESSWDWIDSIGLESAKERIDNADVVFVEIDSSNVSIRNANES